MSFGSRQKAAEQFVITSYSIHYTKLYDGAIIRTAVAAGVDAIIIPKERAVDVTPTVFKTSAGTVFRIPIIKVSNLNSTINEMKEMGYWFVGTSLETEKSYDEINYNFKLCLIVGNEGKGISQLVSYNFV